MDNLDYWPATGAAYTVGDTRYPVFAHDWRRTDVPEWLSRQAARRVAPDPRDRTPNPA